MDGSENNPAPGDPTKDRGGRRLWLTRRRFLTLLGGAAAFAAGGGVYCWRIEPHWIEIVRRDLPIAHLPASLAGRTLALIGDLHVGRVVDGDYIRGSIDLVNSLRADVVAFAGDFISGASHVPDALDVVSRLTIPPLGALAVLGNHDYGEKYSLPATARSLEAGLGRLGIRVLRNELASVGGLQIAGLDDFWADDGASHEWGPGPFFRPQAVLPRLDPAAPAIVLAHNPDSADSPGWGSYRGWILCGHSHGGQVDLPLIGPPILPLKNRRYVRGPIDLSDGRRLYVNRGLGYLMRVRLFSRPEITLFTLKSA